RPAHVRAHGLRAQPLSPHAPDAARFARAAGGDRDEADRPARGRGRRRARVPHAARVRPRARRRLRRRGGRALPRPARSAAGRAVAGRRGRRDRRDVRASGAARRGADAAGRAAPTLPGAAPARRARGRGGRGVRGGLSTLGWLLGRYMRPYWPKVALLASPFKGVVVLCLLYVAVGWLKAIVDFASYILTLWIRTRAGAAMQRDLFQHLLGLSMGFFTRQRTGELVSRLETDTRSTTGGLETTVGTVLTAPLLIAFYGYLLVRTSPRLVIAAVTAALLHWGVTSAIRTPIRRFAAAQLSIFAELA